VKIEKIQSFHGGREYWEKISDFEWLSGLFNTESVVVKPGGTEQIRSHVELELAKAGWALNAPVDVGFNLMITAKKSSLGFQIQTGNISRAMYDLLKLQTMYLNRTIEAACLAVPSGAAANIIGGNLANANRLSEELKLFGRHITVPLVLLAFE
jgi:hypothetical protein